MPEHPHNIHDTLAERHLTHGDFREQSERARVLKDYMQTAPKWRYLPAGQKEALDMIAVKVARILTGNPHHADSWHDIAGYATLAERECEHAAGPGTAP